jgi:hypothetical protein
MIKDIYRKYYNNYIYEKMVLENENEYFYYIY